MPRAFGTKQLLAPSQGLVTEQSKLVPVEGSTVDEVNFTYNDDGSIRKRRFGVNKETDASFFTFDDSVNSTEYTSYGVWKAVGGDGSLNFHVFQTGRTLHFVKDAVGNLTAQVQAFSYNIDNNAASVLQTTGNDDGAGNAAFLTDSGEAWVVDIFVGSTIFNTTDGSSGLVTSNTATTVTATLTGGTDDDWDNADAYVIADATGASVSMTNGDGKLFVVSPLLNPFYITYDPDTATLSSTVVNLLIRDLTGLDDSLAVDERPSGITEEHEYNLDNQGWWQTRRIVAAGSFVDPAVQFKTTNGVYPSNADIALLGMVDDGSGNIIYDPDYLLELTLGNTPAPKGHFVISPFDINYEALRLGTGGSPSYGGIDGFGSDLGSGTETPPPDWWDGEAPVATP